MVNALKAQSNRITLGRVTQAPAERAEALIQAASFRGVKLATAESCTAGGIAAALGAVPGASRAFWAAWVVYTPEAKCKLLGLPSRLTRRSVSRATAKAMAQAAAKKVPAPCSTIAITGIAGPTGGTASNPLGTAWCCVTLPGGAVRVVRLQARARGRVAIQRELVGLALAFWLEVWRAGD